MERWERIYAKFFWAIVILVVVGGSAVAIQASVETGKLCAEAIYLLKLALLFVPICLIWRAILSSSTVIAWSSKGRLYCFVIYLAMWSSVYLLPKILIGSSESWSEAIGFTMCMAVSWAVIANPIRAKSSTQT